MIKRLNFWNSFFPFSFLGFGLILFILTFFQIKQEEEKYLAANAKSLQLASYVVGTSIGYSSNSLSDAQRKNALSLMKLLTYEENINCVQLNSTLFEVSYPPVQYCDALQSSSNYKINLQNSRDIKLVLFISDKLLLAKKRQIIVSNIASGFILFSLIQIVFRWFLLNKAAKDSRESDRRLDNIITSSPSPTLLVSSDLMLGEISNSYESFSPGSREKYEEVKSFSTTVHLSELIEKSSCQRIDYAIRSLIDSDSKSFISLQGIAIKSLSINQGKRTAALLLSTAEYSDQNRYVLTFSDITGLIAQRDLLDNALSRDYLTQSFSRQYLVEKFADGIRAKDYALFLLDVDSFKSVNDRFGHDVGDQLLCKLVKSLQEFKPGLSVVFRLSGDEFILLVPCTTIAQLRSLSEDLYLYSSVSISNTKTSFRQTFSFGSVLLCRDDNLSSKMTLADGALIKSKQKGKHNFLVEEDSTSQAIASAFEKRIILIDDVEKAYEKNQISLFVQPVIDSASSAIVGSEALARWVTDTGSSIPPEMFIDSLYQLTILPDSGVDHFELAKKMLRDLNPEIPGWIAYNINRYDLTDELFPRLIDLQQYSAKDFRRAMVFEVSETTLQSFGDTSQVVDKIGILKSGGALIALDDFGVLSSNFLSLSKLPVDIVKLDKFLVDGIEEDLKNQLIVKSLLDLADSLGFSLIAEGIEDLSSLNFLRNMGINLHQGYYYAKAMPVDEFNLFKITA